MSETTPTENRCCATVWSPLGNGRSIKGDCYKRGSHVYEGRHYCGTHYPPNEEKRAQARVAEREKRRKEEDAKWTARAAEADLRERALAAIKQIAAGHNDPRALALAVLNPSPTPRE